MGTLTKKIQRSKNESTVRRIKTAQEAHREGYLQGLKDADVAMTEILEERLQKVISDVDTVLTFFVERLSTLDEVKDIGPKRYQAILKHLDYENKEDLKGRWQRGLTNLSAASEKNDELGTRR